MTLSFTRHLPQLDPTPSNLAACSYMFIWLYVNDVVVVVVFVVVLLFLVVVDS